MSWSGRWSQRSNSSPARTVGAGSNIAAIKSHPIATSYNLSKASLFSAALYASNFNGANFNEAKLRGSDATFADFIGATFIGADISWVTFIGCNFSGANLTEAFCELTDFRDVILQGVNFEKAIFNHTVLGATNLAGVVGLETCVHHGPSIIDHQTLARSGRLPLIFLRGCGLPDIFIEFLPSLLNDPVQFHSCFISYSSNDHAFAERLYADLQNKGVRCWFAPEDLKIGAELRAGIDESIRLHDKLLLVLSETSVKSQWVQQEVETALAKEREQERTVLFPIRLDDAVMQIGTGWPAYLKHTRNVGDFTRWKEHDSYQQAFNRLIRDLKAGV
jgi:uncharacterized protein YjbI with pentapeptide repeats